MEATIANFRRGRHTVYNNQMILNIKGYDKEKSKSLIGKQVIWKSPGKQKKELKGKITRIHGNSGAVRAKFDTGMPGQSIGKKVDITE